ncbi:hypothetical protein PCAR4_1210040 [Paraburkholderia caribensis]|nr:hypothetical protein PCAR4_1210040 [Paraburkholderia caribensis]
MHSLVLVDGPGSTTTQPSIAIGVSGIMHHGQRVPLHSTVALADAAAPETHTLTQSQSCFRPASTPAQNSTDADRPDIRQQTRNSISPGVM